MARKSRQKGSEEIGEITGPPFRVYIPSLDDFTRFTNYEGVGGWAAAQNEQWTKAQPLAGQHGQASQLAFRTITAFFNNLANEAANATNPAHSKDQTQVAHQSICVNLELIQQGKYPPADSPTAERIFEDMATDPAASAARLIWAVGNSLDVEQQFSADMIKALIEVYVEDMTGFDEPAVQKSRLTNLRAHWDTEFATTENRAKDRLALGIRLGGKAVRRLYRTSKAHAKEMARIENTFTEEMRLRAPATYWSERVATSNRTAGLALAAFVGVGAAAAISLFWNWDGVKELIAVSNKSSGINLLPAVAITLPAVLLLWLLRLISRIFVSGLSTARDSSHRSTLIQTYLALMAEESSGVTEQDRLLILQALFRPENVSADDDAPPPNLLEIMAKSAGIKAK